MNIDIYDDATRELILKTESQRKQSNDGLKETSEELFKVAMESSDDTLKGYAYYIKAECCYLYSPNQDEFKDYALNAVKYLRLAGETHFLGKCYNLFAVEALLCGNDMLGLDYLLSTIKMSLESNDSYLRGIAESNIGHIYIKLGNYNEALSHIDTAIKNLDKNTTDPRYSGNIILVLAQRGLCLLEISPNNYEEAERILNRIYEVRGDIQNKYYDLAVYRLEMKIAHYKGDFEWRDKIIETAIDMIDECLTIADLVEDLCDMGYFLISIGDMDDAAKVLNALYFVEGNTEIINVKIEIVKYAIKYYDAKADEDKKLAEIVKYYKYSRVLEKSSNDEIAFFMKVRKTLDEVRARKEEVEDENRRLSERADFDQLTGLPNRYSLNDFSEKAFEKAYVEKKNLAVEMLDIDYFKQFNDTYGHQEGDRCLKRVSESINQLCRENEGVYAARYGGDEFVIIYEDRTDDEIVILATKLRKMIADLKIPSCAPEVGPYVTISQGIRNSVPKSSNKLWDYMYTADNALYSVKKSVKGEIAILHSAVISEKSLESRKHF